jgi:WD40 repeat protein
LTAEDPTASAVKLRGYEGPIDAVAISPDERWLFTGSSDGTVRLWALKAKDPAANPIVLHGQEGRITALAVGPDNQWLATGSSDGAARLWPLRMNTLIELARGKTGRNLTADEWKLYFPGEKYRKTFPELPGPD